MSDTTEVLCPDGKHRAFHIGHIKNGARTGYVFASNKRVYGTITPGTACFVPNPDGKHAHLVRGVFEQPAQVDHATIEDVIDDQRADIREEALRQEVEIERDDFALASSVD